MSFTMFKEDCEKIERFTSVFDCVLGSVMYYWAEITCIVFNRRQSD